MNVRIISYNLNGIRAAMGKGLADWLNAAGPDIFCIQELKAEHHQFEVKQFEDMGYHCYWHSAVKKGYSGVALLSKISPEKVTIGCEIPEIDNEGRIIRADYKDFSVMSVYFPSGTSGDERQGFKYVFLDKFFDYIHQLIKHIPNLIICGDINICHHPIDIHNPVSNKNSTGFLPEERAWVSKFVDSGFVDTFREFNQDPHHYTWWSYRFNSRKQNKGWRIDYQFATLSLKSKLKRAAILPEAYHSDHCPTLLEIEV
jgi:exodeoxyribonuclease III